MDAIKTAAECSAAVFLCLASARGFEAEGAPTSWEEKASGQTPPASAGEVTQGDIGCIDCSNQIPLETPNSLDPALFRSETFFSLDIL